MTATLTYDGIEATLTGGVWSSESSLLADYLNTRFSLRDYPPTPGNPLSQAMMAGVVLGVGVSVLPLEEGQEGRVY